MVEGLLLIDKPKKTTSFFLVQTLRNMTNVRKIGHAGTLDPLATGVMLLLIGPSYTKKSSFLIQHEKEYRATLLLGKSSNTFDMAGEVKERSNVVPSLVEIEKVLSHFQGTISQIPPMFSAKKYLGKKLYEFARKGIDIERQPVRVNLKVKLLSYQYPLLHLYIFCSSGTYIRSLAHDIGSFLQVGAVLFCLTRTKLGPYLLKECLPFDRLTKETILKHLKTEEA